MIDRLRSLFREPDVEPQVVLDNHERDFIWILGQVQEATVGGVYSIQQGWGDKGRDFMFPSDVIDCSQILLERGLVDVVDGPQIAGLSYLELSEEGKNAFGQIKRQFSRS